MLDIREIIKNVELHDSTLESIAVKGDGTVDLFVDLDEVWNKDVGENIIGIRFSSVYEISEYKIDRLNIIGSIEVELIDGYSKEFVTHLSDEPEPVRMVSIELVAGGRLVIKCSGMAELIRRHA